MVDKQDMLKRVYSSLLSLKKNLPINHPNNLMEESYVGIYNEQLDKLESIGLDVSDFRIPDDQLEYRRTSYNGITKISTYSKEKYVKYGYFHTKLDSLLTYFELNQSTNKTEIGFQATDY